MATFTYVYILQSELDQERFYTTLDLRKRLTRHNNGQIRHTSKWKPWRLKNYIAFATMLEPEPLNVI